MKKRTLGTEMLKIILILPLIALFFSTAAFAQKDGKIFTNAEAMQAWAPEKIDKGPLYPGCEGEDSSNDCMMLEVAKYVADNFNFDLATELGLSGRQEILVRYIIDASGNVAQVTAQASHPKLEEEAVRVIKSLPQSVPGEHEGAKVNVAYSIPILFDVD